MRSIPPHPFGSATGIVAWTTGVVGWIVVVAIALILLALWLVVRIFDLLL